MASSDDPIYDFPLVKAALKRRGIDVEYTGGYKIIRPSDVIFESGERNIEFQNDKGEDGIFIKDKAGHYHQVFMYKRDYHLGYGVSPRYHIRQCNTIQVFMESGRFREHYRYANTDEVIVQDMDNGYQEETRNDLQLCGYCAALVREQYNWNMSLEEFVNILKEAGEADPDDEKKEVDMFGYVRNWQNISQAKRELENYTCEQCGFKATNIFDRRFIHVHHKDGNKLNNRQENLQCLCIRCHANVDDHHRENFKKSDMHLQLEEFNSLHKPIIKCIHLCGVRRYMKEIGETTFSWRCRISTNKVVGILIGERQFLFHESMGDMSGEDRKQKLFKSVIIQDDKGKVLIYPRDNFEFVRVYEMPDSKEQWIFSPPSP